MSFEEDARVQEKVMGWSPERDTCPMFTTDAASDYLVLVHVREAWDETRQALFISSLCDRLRIRDTEYRTTSTVWLVMFGNGGLAKGYRSGDYARAALAVVESQDAEAKP